MRLGGSQGRSGQVRKISPPPGFDPRTVQPVASRYTEWATGPTSILSYPVFTSHILLTTATCGLSSCIECYNIVWKTVQLSEKNLLNKMYVFFFYFLYIFCLKRHSFWEEFMEMLV
jgi:hypothetical protein